MINVKSKQEIGIMQEGGKILSSIKEELREMIKPGVTPRQIDKVAEELITKAGGEPAFKMVKDYYWSTCININEGVVHGIPTTVPFLEGDIVSVDIGMYYKGFNTDTSFTQIAGKSDSGVTKFLETGRLALKKSISLTRPGNHILDISKAMQEVVEESGYSPIRALTGHGIGRKLHEDPYIPCFWEERSGKGEIIPEGAVFAIEVIYAQGNPDLILLEDNWTIATKDGKIASLFEETVAVTSKGPLVLTV